MFNTGLLVVLGLSFLSGFVECTYDDLLKLEPKASENVQQDAVLGLIKRLLPEHAHLFVVNIDKKFVNNMLDKFKIENGNSGMIKITGNTGVAAANGLNYYLKKVANCSISWSGNQLKIPLDKLPALNSSIEMIIRDKFRYYQNVCTVSYSMAWWDWKRWQQEIDWMALRGINLPLAFNGQEMVFRRTFEKFNLTTKEIDDYFTGPAFLAWNRMGNIQTWSGPLTDHWHQGQYKLQLQILKEMRNLGMYPVVPGFAGHVPRSLSKVLSQAKIDKLTDWNRFGVNNSFTYFLEPEDPNFVKIGKVFIEEYIKLYGTDHFYNIDLFNEEKPTSSDPAYLYKCGKGVYDSIVAADPKGIWIMQGWLFHNQANFWGTEQVKAMVTSVPQNKLIILDLFSETYPIYPKMNAYYGQPFIWCMLQNFGGVIGMFGAFNKINEKVFDTRKQYANMLGIGLTPEGIEQNDVIYDYMLEVPLHEKKPNMAQWFSDYATRRYGFAHMRNPHLLDKAWQLLRISVYTDPIGVTNHGRYVVISLPKLNLHSTMWYDRRNVTEATKLFANFLHDNPNAKDSETFAYDIADVTRQSLQLIFDFYYEKMSVAYLKKDLDAFRSAAKSMDHTLELMENVLQTSKHFLLFNWIDSARKLGNDTKESDYNEWQARNQITTWGPNANILDYAVKQWSGVVKYYLQPRWKLFTSRLEESLLEDYKFDQNLFKSDCLKLVEEPFTRAKQQDLIQKPNVSNLQKLVDEVVDIIHQTIDKEHIPVEEQYSNENSFYKL